jgi:peptidoglycan/xylan/chitin deacetylase (PgdA/CDA1 family)
MKPVVTIFTFHALDAERDVVSYPPSLFERLIRTLHIRGPQVLSLADAVRGLTGETGLPRRSAVITFDDGYRSVYEVAFPTLRQYALPATVFLTAASDSRPHVRLPAMQGRTMLSWAEIREMLGSGIDFGAHTLSHADLPRLAAADAEREMEGSKVLLERALGQPVTCFAYPFGRYDRRSLALARRHFDCAVSDRLGFARRGADVHALPRVDAYYLRRARLVDLVSSRSFEWYIRMRAIPRRARRAAQTFREA